MSTAAIHPKGAHKMPAGDGPGPWASAYLTSTVGKKVLVGLTGLGLVTFVVFHMIGNLKMFSGRDEINTYAYFLKHELGVLIWVARAGLLGIFVLHIGMTLWLKTRSNASRPIAYVRYRPAQATTASRSMLWTGVVVGFFTLFHLAHYTFGYVHGVEVNGVYKNYLELTDENGRHDVYRMIIAGFTTWWISALYLVAQAALFVHLSHGIASAFRTLGIFGRRFSPVGQWIAYITGATLFFGNAAIVIAVWTKLLK